MAATVTAPTSRNILVPARGADDWQRLLADPEKQWKAGRSARTLAHCWHAGTGFPRSVADVLATASDRALAVAEMLLAVPERQVALPGGGHASQIDLWILAADSDGLISIAVEGKVDEPFGEQVATWLERREKEAAARNAESGARTRLRFLCELLGLPEEDALPLRYQLLHRTASALVEAERFRAGKALMLVHSFDGKRAGYDDFADFVQALGAAPAPDLLSSIGVRAGISVHLGWVSGEQEYLRA